MNTIVSYGMLKHAFKLSRQCGTQTYNQTYNWALLGGQFIQWKFCLRWLFKSQGDRFK